MTNQMLHRQNWDELFCNSTEHSTVTLDIWRGTQKTPELSPGGQVPCSTGFPHEVSVLGTHLYQCTSWRCCERMHLALVISFEKSFSVFAHFMIDDLEHTWPPCTECLAVFDQNQHDPPMPHLPYSPNLSPSDTPALKKNPQRETFCQCGRGKTKNGRSTKRH